MEFAERPPRMARGRFRRPQPIQSRCKLRDGQSNEGELTGTFFALDVPGGTLRSRKFEPLVDALA